LGSYFGFLGRRSGLNPSVAVFVVSATFDVRHGLSAERALTTLLVKPADDVNTSAVIASKGRVVAKEIFICAVRIEISSHRRAPLNSGDSLSGLPPPLLSWQVPTEPGSKQWSMM
jgi:hypothetical protein